MAVPIKLKRGTRAQLDTAASAGELLEGEPYLITDEPRIALGLSTTTYQTFAKDDGDRLNGSYEFYAADDVTWHATIDGAGVQSAADVSVANNYSLTFGDGTGYLYGYDDAATLSVGWQMEIVSNANGDGYGDLILDSGGSNVTLAAGGGVSITGDVTIAGTITAQLGVNDQTASYTLALADAGQYLRVNNASANTVTVPPNSTAAFSVGTQVTVRQVGAGQTTIAAGTGVTINSPETLKLRAQHSTATLIKVATDEWDLMGDLEASP